MKRNRPMGKIGKVGGPRRGSRKRLHGLRRRPLRPIKRFGAPHPRKVLFERSGGCSMVLAAVIVIASLFIIL
ncbi:hypothetical protein HN358_01380 [Candidatus Uhrbacteria bacterium]|nr:hypothetical protein [Candidatus Uhrbacteria bacterium]MBT7717318.1 hypothetical protein [Candidatus Uhrbacteria bacterium]